MSLFVSSLSILKRQIEGSFFEEVIHIDHTWKLFYCLSGLFQGGMDVRLGASRGRVSKEALNDEDIDFLII